jgi:hypothetical protein
VWYNPTKENEIQLVAVSHSQEKKKKGEILETQRQNHRN